MPMTEDEAKTKQCPLTFAVPEIRGSDGSGIREGGPWVCCASACMAWRFASEAYDEFDRIHDLPKPAGETNPPFSNCPEGYHVTSYGGTSFTASRKTGTLPATGYCGLAGADA